MTLGYRFIWMRRAAACLTLALMAAHPALAQPALIALVIGNGTYSSFPALPACLKSSQDLADALRDLGYQVIERQDLSSGGMGAAIGEVARGMETTPDASVFVYVCGYAAGMNDRPFLLPVSANIQRPSDVMTQGILAKALLDVLVRGKPSRGLLVLDLVPAPDHSAPVLGTLMDVPAPEGTGLIGVIGSPPAAGSTALSMALASELTRPGVKSGALLAGVESQLKADPAAHIGALRLPSVSRPLAADEPPPPPPPLPPQSEDTAQGTGGRTATPTQGAASVPFPEEGAMTIGERRRVQEALRRLGYYAGEIDGLFGPETRAAIRRFQHEIGVTMTGIITGAQATRLLSAR